MKKTDIVAGKTYTNGKAGRFYGERRVLELGPQFKLYPSQTETDCLSYVVVRGRCGGHAVEHGTTPEGSMILHSTRASFAAWASAIVREDPSHD